MGVLRRLLAGLLLAVGLLAGTGALACFWAQSTVFDDARTGRVATALLASPALRGQLAARLSTLLEARLPAQAQASPQAAAAVAGATSVALADPRTQTAVAGALTGLHARLVGDATGPVRLDGGPISQAVADALETSNPRLAASVRATPLSVDLPLTSVPSLSAENRLTRDAELPLAGVAAVGVLGALLISPRRPRTLRRVGWWLLTATAGQVLLLVVAPRVLLPQLGTGWSDLASALVTAWAAGLTGPLTALAATGIALVVAGIVWGVAARSGGGRAPAVRRGTPPPRYLDPETRYAGVEQPSRWDPVAPPAEYGPTSRPYAGPHQQRPPYSEPHPTQILPVDRDL